MEIDIKNYIEFKIPELKDRLFPLFSTDISKISVTYTFTPVKGGVVRQSELELKILHNDYDVCKEYEKKINDILDIQEDKPSVTYGNTYFRSSLSGGGVLFNDGPQMYEDTLIYVVKWRNL